MKFHLILLSLLLVAGCTGGNYIRVNEYPDIFPDYTGVTVPESMTDLPFRMVDGRSFTKSVRRVGDTLFVGVRAMDKQTGEGVEYSEFPVYISSDAIDPYIAYRLIEPGYEGWNRMSIYQRELSSFSEKEIVTNRINDGGCVNCHTFDRDGSSMLFHVRGNKAGTVILKDGIARKINPAEIGPRRQATYPAWHPGGRYVAFSSNTTCQCFTINDAQPIEVYDTASDIILLDTESDSICAVPALYTDNRLETFPDWSTDGDKLYFCVSDTVSSYPSDRGRLRYRIESIDFDKGTFADTTRTVWESDSASASFPRVNGDWMLFTVSDFATFPIWHSEADLWLMNLRSGLAVPASELNSEWTESYHSWSSNGRWVIFSSRRLDGRYTRLYISHFDGQGHFTKPFLLPQKNPDFNTLRLKSYNVPTFVTSDFSDRQSYFAELFK